ncbi:MAG: ComF family protein [Candidatus Pacebacteria bacterium]|nr:ComF family protein [Candidatus Paceibacterota bacterium]
MWKRIKNQILNLLFPQFCLKCNKEGFLICPDCFSTIDLNPFQYCPFCSVPNRVIKKGKCQSHQSFKLNGVFSACDYKNPLVKKMIFLFKYEPYIKNLGFPLSNLIISHFALTQKQGIFNSSASSKKAPLATPSTGSGQVFMPVPLFKKRERTRGYNQSAVIAEILSVAYKLPFQKNNLIKIKNTKSQTEFSKKQREQNIAGAFAIKNPALISEKTIFLVDDVFTTGSTMEECARVLKANGAKKVFGIVVAREGLRI